MAKHINMDFRNIRRDIMTKGGDVFEVFKIVKINNIINMDIIPYVKYHEYFPIIYFPVYNRYVFFAGKDYQQVLASGRYEFIEEMLEKYTKYEIIDVVKYDIKEGWVTIGSDDYSVDLI